MMAKDPKINPDRTMQDQTKIVRIMNLPLRSTIRIGIVECWNKGNPIFQHSNIPLFH
jgi:hypothetical protein